MPKDAGLVDSTLVCTEAVPLPWHPSFPWSCHSLYNRAGTSCFPILHTRQKSIWNQSYWHLHRPVPWPWSCTLFYCFCSGENWDVSNTSRMLPSAATHGKNSGDLQVTTLEVTADSAPSCLHTLPPLLPVLAGQHHDPDRHLVMSSPPYEEMANTSTLNNKPKQQALKPGRPRCLRAQYVHERVAR